ncbi:MAG TPA: glutamyl-tRNA reductase [Terriglobales bacterium]|nr:glutamyl-tRNA reductase [Terriglobales bacterium]
MSLWLLGTNHRTAPIEERERMAISAEALPAALGLLREQAEVREGLILSTCNRVEVVAASAEGSRPDLHGFLVKATGNGLRMRPGSFYEAQESQVVRHLFRVASSLDSLIVGEPQVLGQLKTAYAQAQAAGTTGPELDTLLPRAFHAAKRVRSETAIASQPVSVSQAAVGLAHQIFGGLHDRVVLLLGAGEAGESAARALMREGSQRLLVMSRTLARAQALAQKFQAEAIPLESLAQVGEVADIVISCTGSPEPLVRRSDAAHFLSRRRGRPMLFLDLAVPRDIEPSVHQLENAFVYNVDDLDRVVQSNLTERRQEAEAGERIIEIEVNDYLHRKQAKDAAPILRALHGQAEAMRAGEWERARKRLGSLTADQEAAIEALTRTLMNKWMHQPMVRIKESSRAAERDAMLELIQRLFGLDDDLKS